MLYLISYDVKNPSQDYAKIESAILRLGEYLHCQRSVFVLSSRLNIRDLRDHIRTLLDEDDLFFIVDITGQPRDGWMYTSHWDWRRAHDY